MNGSYVPRVIDSYLGEVLESSGAVLIEGVKWCGKTRTAERKAASAVYMRDPDNMRKHTATAEIRPSRLLVGDTPRLIDEWQTAPILWDAVKFAVDERGKPGQFILTGSAAPTDDPARHSGAGRISRITMRPMSLFESGESDGSVSLQALFDRREEIDGFAGLTLEMLSAALVRGGWPSLIGATEKQYVRETRSYVEAIINTDLSKADGARKSPAVVREVMRSLSRNISTSAKMSTIRKDMMGDDLVSEKTISSYINSLRGVFVVEDVLAWNPSLRSQTSIAASPKRHFVDPSIATAVMRASPEDLMDDLNTFGLLFESLCVRDLRVYSQVLDGDVFHYRDRNGLEADAIVHLRDGRWGAIEVKLGPKEIEKGAGNLKKLRDNIDTGNMRAPSFLMVLTAEGLAYERGDGVLVVPIGCLKD
ncbi:MAG: DUF4143 domain-containing protein [Methanomassiliicoccaceae archaeon]|nr:DUF4143 domain-containing protein [Methanomassiliicoccaceae archaeon]